MVRSTQTLLCSGFPVSHTFLSYWHIPLVPTSTLQHYTWIVLCICLHYHPLYLHCEHRCFNFKRLVQYVVFLPSHPSHVIHLLTVLHLSVMNPFTYQPRRLSTCSMINPVTFQPLRSLTDPSNNDLDTNSVIHRFQWIIENIPTTSLFFETDSLTYNII